MELDPYPFGCALKVFLFWVNHRWNNRQQEGKTDDQKIIAAERYGFGSVSRRISTKPIIAAVIGGAYGGGLEMIINCDLVVTHQDAKFGFPEVTKGVLAIEGIPRLTQIAGHQVLASPIFHLSPQKHIISSHGHCCLCPIWLLPLTCLQVFSFADTIHLACL